MQLKIATSLCEVGTSFKRTLKGVRIGMGPHVRLQLVLRRRLKGAILEHTLIRVLLRVDLHMSLQLSLRVPLEVTSFNGTLELYVLRMLALVLLQLLHVHRFIVTALVGAGILDLPEMIKRVDLQQCSGIGGIVAVSKPTLIQFRFVVRELVRPQLFLTHSHKITSFKTALE